MCIEANDCFFDYSFDRDMRSGGGDMDLRGTPGLPQQQPPPVQFMGSQFDSDFRLQNSAFPRHHSPGSPRRSEEENPDPRQQENWSTGPRKRRWGDAPVDDEDSNQMDPFRHMSPVEADDSPSNGRSFAMEREDNFNKRSGNWGGSGHDRSFSPLGQGEPMHHQMEGGFRNRGGRGGFSNRGRGGGRGGSRGRFRGRGGRGPKRGQF